MPIKKSAAKALRQTKKRLARNKKVTGEIDFLIKKLKKSLTASQAEEAKDWLAKAVQKIDKAVQKKIIKKNTAARRKSRLTKQLNKVFKK